MSIDGARARLPTLVGALLAIVVSGCGNGNGDGEPDEAPPPPPRACTLIGCAPGTTIVLEGAHADARTARICVEGECETLPFDPRFPLTTGLPRSAREAGARVRVRVRLIDSDGNAVGRASGRASVRRSRPNGPRCPPVCFRARLRLDMSG